MIRHFYIYFLKYLINILKNKVIKIYRHDKNEQKMEMRALCSQVVFLGFHRPDWRSWILDISRNVQNRVLNFKPRKVVFQQ